MRTRLRIIVVVGALLSLGTVEAHVCAQNAQTWGTDTGVEAHPPAKSAGRVGHPALLRSAGRAQDSRRDPSTSSGQAAGATVKEVRGTHQAAGPFEVKLTPDPFADKNMDSTLGRMLIEKQFHGDLEATSKGEMLTVATSVKGSGVYVAVERVTGSLQGRKGSFALHHTGVMTRGAPELHITVVPDSGTEELEGIIGTMMIKIEGGKHSYEFDYSLPLGR